MPANHPFLDPDPVRAQAARDAAKPMAPREGETPLLRDGTVWEVANANSPSWWRDGCHPFFPSLDIIAAVDASGRVIRTAEGDVPVAGIPAPAKTPDRDRLDALLKKAREWWDTASDEEKEAMFEAQKASWVRAESGWAETSVVVRPPPADAPQAGGITEAIRANNGCTEVECVDKTGDNCQCAKDADAQAVSECPVCGCRSLSACDELKPDGRYGPGRARRCHECKTVWGLPPADAPQAGAVKALVWTTSTDNQMTVGFQASTPTFMRYRVWPSGTSGLWLLRINDDEAYTQHPDEDAAKAAAQADYTARILSALPEGARVVTAGEWAAMRAVTEAAEHAVKWKYRASTLIELEEAIAAMRRIAGGE